MYGILGEHQSDVDTLKVLVRRLACDQSLPIKSKGFDGCGRMLQKGARQLQDFVRRGCKRFIVCHDADGPDPSPKRDLVNSKIIQPSGIARDIASLFPFKNWRRGSLRISSVQTISFLLGNQCLFLIPRKYPIPRNTWKILVVTTIKDVFTTTSSIMKRWQGISIWRKSHENALLSAYWKSSSRRILLKKRYAKYRTALTNT